MDLTQINELIENSKRIFLENSKKQTPLTIDRIGKAQFEFFPSRDILAKIETYNWGFQLWGRKSLYFGGSGNFMGDGIKYLDFYFSENGLYLLGAKYFQKPSSRLLNLLQIEVINPSTISGILHSERKAL